MREYLGYLFAVIVLLGFTVFAKDRSSKCEALGGVLVVGIVRLQCVQPTVGTLPTHAPVTAGTLSSNPFAQGTR